MRNTTFNTWIIQIISSLLILLFIYTASSKLFEFESFKHGLLKSPLIGNKALFVAVAVPTSEIIISLLLVAPLTRIIGLYASLGLMTLFTLYISYMLLFAQRLPCGCGGVFKNMGWKLHLLFNIFFTILSLTGIWLYRKNEEKKLNLI